MDGRVTRLPGWVSDGLDMEVGGRWSKMYPVASQVYIGQAVSNGIHPRILQIPTGCQAVFQLSAWCTNRHDHLLVEPRFGNRTEKRTDLYAFKNDGRPAVPTDSPQKSEMNLRRLRDLTSHYETHCIWSVKSMHDSSEKPASYRYHSCSKNMSLNKEENFDLWM